MGIKFDSNFQVIKGPGSTAIDFDSNFQIIELTTTSGPTEYPQTVNSAIDITPNHVNSISTIKSMAFDVLSSAIKAVTKTKTALADLTASVTASYTVPKAISSAIAATSSLGNRIIGKIKSSAISASAEKSTTDVSFARNMTIAITTNISKAISKAKTVLIDFTATSEQLEGIYKTISTAIAVTSNKIRNVSIIKSVNIDSIPGLSKIISTTKSVLIDITSTASAFQGVLKTITTYFTLNRNHSGLVLTETDDDYVPADFTFYDFIKIQDNLILASIGANSVALYEINSDGTLTLKTTQGIIFRNAKFAYFGVENKVVAIGEDYADNYIISSSIITVTPATYSVSVASGTDVISSYGTVKRDSVRIAYTHHSDVDDAYICQLSWVSTTNNTLYHAQLFIDDTTYALDCNASTRTIDSLANFNYNHYAEIAGNKKAETEYENNLAAIVWQDNTDDKYYVSGIGASFDSIPQAVSDVTTCQQVALTQIGLNRFLFQYINSNKIYSRVLVWTGSSFTIGTQYASDTLFTAGLSIQSVKYNNSMVYSYVDEDTLSNGVQRVTVNIDGTVVSYSGLLSSSNDDIMEIEFQPLQAEAVIIDDIVDRVLLYGKNSSNDTRLHVIDYTQGDSTVVTSGLYKVLQTLADVTSSVLKPVGYLKTILSNIGITSNIAKVINKTKSATISGLTTIVKAINNTRNNSIIISSAESRITLFLRTIASNITIIAQEIKQVNLVKSDSVNVTNSKIADVDITKQVNIDTTSGLIRVIARTLATLTNITSSITKIANKIISSSAILTASTSMLSAFGYLISSSFTIVSNRIKDAGIIKSDTTDLNTNIIKDVDATKQNNIIALSTVIKNVSKILGLSILLVSLATKVTLKQFTNNVVLTATRIVSVGKLVSSSINLASSLLKVVGKNAVQNLIDITTIAGRGFDKLVNMTLNITSSLGNRIINKITQININITPNILKSVAKSIIKTIYIISGIIKGVDKVINSLSNIAINISKHIYRVFTTPISVQSSISKVINIIKTSNIDVTVSLSKTVLLIKIASAKVTLNTINGAVYLITLATNLVITPTASAAKMVRKTIKTWITKHGPKTWIK